MSQTGARSVLMRIKSDCIWVVSSNERMSTPDQSKTGWGFADHPTQKAVQGEMELLRVGAYALVQGTVTRKMGQ